MTIAAGFVPGQGGRAALDLALQLARSGTAEPVAVVTVVSAGWRTPSPARVDAEFAAWAAEQGARALAAAGEQVAAAGPDVTVTYRTVAGSSVRRTLLAAAAEAVADLLVLGSSGDGPLGRLVLGSTSEPLLHSSPLAVAVAPRGYRVSPAPGSAG
ncbi:universal stress protein [Nakamurella endophytica]|uniref:UspA domain-containing protein n=1 Tax=Nakamurella endophytica TaxID=1748367 RepID=A0A917WEY3_9ACTN|nr:universal stress protein [Nakamurella endophytica]GGL96694.1 hypothetical protein GCM10011594_15530 [Nakamurella endophytica]